MGITPKYYQILLYIWSIANVDWYKFFLTKIKKTYGDGNIFLCVKYLGRIVFTFLCHFLERIRTKLNCIITS